MQRLGPVSGLQDAVGRLQLLGPPDEVGSEDPARPPDLGGHEVPPPLRSLDVEGLTGLRTRPLRIAFFERDGGLRGEKR